MSGLFREQAVRSYLDPDERGGLLRAPAPPGARATLLGAALALGALAVVLSRPVESTTRAPGIVRPAEGAAWVRAAAPGTVARALVREGDRVAAGQPVVALRSPAGLEATLTAPLAGVVDDCPARVGTAVVAGEPLVRVVGGGGFVGWLTLPASQRPRVSPGAVVRLRWEGGGVGAARVRRVAEDRLTRADDERVAPGVAAVSGAYVLVELALEPGTATPGAGTPFTGEVVVGREALVHVLLAH